MCILLAMLFLVFSGLAVDQFGLENVANVTRRLAWSEQDPGFVYHVLANGTEWALFGGASVLFVCMGWRMRVFNVKYPKWWK